ncbi:glycosyltransferase family 2 protein [Virgibacillus halodenitrificans]|uniref:glycosyltransferase family 2 protein n=1 Tax=Virgibacillus halodenitrificans TaxID=1482 RepID=UPI000760E0FB
MAEPLVSVVIPFYSGVNWLKEALNSVQNQTYKNIEVLVINDGSKEDINELVRLYNININIINKDNGGPASARNMGIEKSTGKYIAFLDSDDIWLPDKLKKQIEQMELRAYVWSQHSYEMFWENSDKTKIISTDIYEGSVYKDCFVSFKIQTSCVVVLKSILIEKNINFPLDKRYGQDGAFYKQIAKHYPLGYIDGVLSRFRIRGTNAGFRARIQINSKATTWKEIKDNKSDLYFLPNGIILAYRLSHFLNKFIVWTNKHVLRGRNEASIEWLSKLMYVFPYSIFKMYSKKSR